MTRKKPKKRAPTPAASAFAIRDLAEANSEAVGVGTGLGRFSYKVDDVSITETLRSSKVM